MADQNNSTSILDISIPSFNEKYIAQETITFFQINITNRINDKKWSVERKFSEFQDLHDKLSLIIPSIPSIPGVILFKVSSSDALAKLKTDLEKFLHFAVNRKDILSQPVLKAFLTLESESPEIIAKDINLTFEYSNLPHCVKDFIIIPNKEIMLLCCSEINVFIKSNSILSNFSSPWNKKTDATARLGEVLIYQCKPPSDAKYTINKLWSQSFPIQTNVISWEDESEVLSVGLEDGKIFCFQSKPNTNYIEMNNILELSLHKDRVVGLGYDKDNNTIFSCSSDKAFYMTEIKDEIIPQLLKLSRVGFTNMKYDKKNEKIFLTNELGELFVFTTNTIQPVETFALQVSSLSSINAFHIDEINHFIFTGSENGKINILNMQFEGKEKGINEVCCFKANMKIRICRYNAKNNELIIGDEDGRVTVWNIQNVTPIYVWIAHKNSGITQMVLDEENGILWTGGKDKKFKVWKLPERWYSEEIYNFEESHDNNVTFKIGNVKLKNILNKGEEEDSDSDNEEFSGWTVNLYSN